MCLYQQPARVAAAVKPPSGTHQTAAAPVGGRVNAVSAGGAESPAAGFSSLEEAVAKVCVCVVCGVFAVCVRVCVRACVCLRRRRWRRLRLGMCLGGSVKL